MSGKSGQESQSAVKDITDTSMTGCWSLCQPCPGHHTAQQSQNNWDCCGGWNSEIQWPRREPAQTAESKRATESSQDLEAVEEEEPDS